MPDEEKNINMNVITTERIPIFNFCDKPEEGALKQLRNLASLPFAFKGIAALPGLHQGYGMPIESVLATQGAIIPNAVGVDIGCGMIAFQTNLKAENYSKSDWEKMRLKIMEKVPMGCGREREAASEAEMPRFEGRVPIVESAWTKSRRQLGTLGSGNHFIEIQKDEKGFVWVMIHTGSRNLGKKVCDYYNEKAREAMALFHSKVEPEWDLAFLPMGHPHADLYIREMTYCKKYAERNRLKIMTNVLEVLGIPFNPQNAIDTCHNYAQLENHYGENVWVHRKGTIRAQVGEKGIVPGSQGTHSFITEGLGNPKTFHSSSHGAGRRMGRKEAMRQLDVEKEIAIMEKAGIVHGIVSVEELDEAPSAYKDIDEVLESQKDCCKIITRLSPIAVIKG